MHRYLLILFCLLSIGQLHASNSKDTVYIKEILKTATALQRSNQDSSYKLAQEAYALSIKLNFKKGIGGALIRLGSILYTNGKNDTALLLIRRALIIRESLKDFKGASGACILMSYIFQSKGSHDSAFTFLYQALEFNKQARDSVNMVQTYITLGNLNNDYNNSKGALEYFEMAASLSEQMNYTEGILLSNDGLANYYFKIHEFRKALRYFQINDTLNQRAGDSISYSQNLSSIAACYDALKETLLARTYYSRAISLFLSQGLDDELARGYLNMAKIYISLNNADSSIYFLNKALVPARANGLLDVVCLIYESYAEAYKQRGNYFEAYNYQVKYSNLSDSLLNKEKVKQIAEMQTKYETEKKESQIVILNEQNKTKSLQRNFLVAGSLLLFLLAGAIYMGLLKTRQEKRKTEDLLLNILPSDVAEELKKTGASEAKQYNHVTVLFTDFVNFTGISERMSPTELVKEINKNFTAFDAIIEKHGLEKIKTIGDAYLAVCGLPNETADHAERVIKAALDMQSYINQNKSKFALRIGIHSGPVVAGIVGVKKFAYDIWGDTVNTASRMESNSESGKINISEATYLQTKDKFTFISRGKIDAKHKGLIEMYFVTGLI